MKLFRRKKSIRQTRVPKRKKITIPCVYEDDLKPLLKKLGLLEDVEAGIAECYVCGKLVDYDEVGGLIKANGVPRVMCSNIHCICGAESKAKTRV